MSSPADGLGFKRYQKKFWRVYTRTKRNGLCSVFAVFQNRRITGSRYAENQIPPRPGWRSSKKLARVVIPVLRATNRASTGKAKAGSVAMAQKKAHGSGAPRSGCCPSASSLKWAIAPTNTPSMFSCVCPTGTQFLRAIATSAARSSLSSNGWRTCACRSVVMSSSRRPRSQPKEADRPSRAVVHYGSGVDSGVDSGARAACAA